jgi:hypothetical protein
VRAVSQDWINQWRRTIGAPKFSILGDAGNTTDAGNDGIPDSGWTRKDILAWLAENGVTPAGAYVTKSGLLTLVNGVLNPIVEEVLNTTETTEVEITGE